MRLEHHEDTKSQHRRTSRHSRSNNNRQTTAETKIRSSPTAGDSLHKHALSVPCFDDDQGSETIVFSEMDAVEVVNSKSVRIQCASEQEDDQDSFAQIMNRDRTTSELHSLCQTMNNMDDVTRAKSFFIGSFTDDTSREDYKGETPLHAFSNNKALAAVIGNPNNVKFETEDYLTLYRQPTFDQNTFAELHTLVTSFLVDDLLPSFPGATAIRDNHSHIPFEAGLTDWIDSCRKPGSASPLRGEVGYFSTYTRRVTQVWESAAKFGGRTISMMSTENDRLSNSVTIDDLEKGSVRKNLMGVSAFRVSSRGSLTSSQEMTGSRYASQDSPSLVEMYILTPHARFCLEMLSQVVDELEMFSSAASSSHFRHFDDHDDDEYNSKKDKYNRAVRGIQQFRDKWGPDIDLCAAVVETIASIPNLLRTILSIHDEADMEFAMSTSIIRRVMVKKQSIGKWLTSMLQSPHKEVSHRATDYIQAVSKLCTSGGSPNDKKAQGQADVEAPCCRELVDEVSRLQDFIPSLLALGDKGIEEVSTTLVVRKVLNRMIARPFAATVVICDAIFLALMIAGFRVAVNRMILGASLDSVLKSIYVSNVGIFYFILTEIGKGVALLQVTKNSRRYFMSFWNVIDIMATVLALASSVSMRWQFGLLVEGLDNAQFLRGLLAVTTGFLWLRVLSFLKHINMQLATFVLAILQITKDVLWFVAILLVLVVAFSQMFFTLLAPSSCATGDASARQCQQSEYLLQAYTILLGEFDLNRDSYSTGFSVFLVVVYSFLVTVVLLNVLIAIASDSYEKCLLKSQKLFGRARVMLVAELTSFQSLLRKRDVHENTLTESKREVYSQWWTSAHWTHNWSRGSILFFALSLLVVIAWMIAELFGFAAGDKPVSIVLSLSSVFVNVALFASIMIFLDRNASVVSSDKKEMVDDKPQGWHCSFLQRAVHRLLGATPSGGRRSRRKKRGAEDWNGRVHFLQGEMDRIAHQQKDLIMEQSENLRTMVKQSENRLRTELSGFEARFRVLETTLLEEVKGTKDTNENITAAVHELKALISMAGSSRGDRSPVPSEVDIANGATPNVRNYPM